MARVPAAPWTALHAARDTGYRRTRHRPAGTIRPGRRAPGIPRPDDRPQ
ncbi:hypothetical protein ACFH04_12600 [Streptomyces noboritoensis]|uniref:Uncharacterized protein n=1 Tax=Streptomyces noboritoensis TaxID=67337 RepID=A0ABV6TGK2_9ACTN